METTLEIPGLPTVKSGLQVDELANAVNNLFHNLGKRAWRKIRLKYAISRFFSALAACVAIIPETLAYIDKAANNADERQFAIQFCTGLRKMNALMEKMRMRIGKDPC